jgi:MFS family permease
MTDTVSGTPADTPTDAPARVWDPARRQLLVGLILTITLVAFESLSIITVLPVVAKDLGGLHLYGWVTSAFFLGTLIGLVVAGELTDRHGPAAPFCVGLVIFGIGLLIGATAPRMDVLVAGRFLQGLGGGAVPSVAYAAIGRSFPEQLRPRVFAIMSTAWVIPGLIGPGLSSVVAQSIGWRWVFAGLLPFVAIAAIIATRALTTLPPLTLPNTARGSTTLLPATRVAAGAALVLAGLTTGSLLALPLIAAGALVGFSPLRSLLPPGTLVLAAGLPAVVAVRGLLTFAFFGTDTFVPLEVTAVRHQSTTIAGFAVTAATMLWTAASWTQARLSRYWSGRRLVMTGLVIIGVAIALMSLSLSDRVPVAVIIVGWAIGGYGIGLGYSPLSSLTLRSAEDGREGAASASLQLSDTLGTALGAGVSGAIVAMMSSGTATIGKVSESAGHADASTQHALVLAFAVALAVAVAAVVAARRLPGGVLAAPAES